VWRSTAPDVRQNARHFDRGNKPGLGNGLFISIGRGLIDKFSRGDTCFSTTDSIAIATIIIHLPRICAAAIA
jgi:hypothetical protein